jgi:hypothetical protein
MNLADRHIWWKCTVCACTAGHLNMNLNMRSQSQCDYYTLNMTVHYNNKYRKPNKSYEQWNVIVKWNMYFFPKYIP